MARHDNPAPGSAQDCLSRAFNNSDPAVRMAAIQDLRELLDQEEQQAAFDMRLKGWTWDAVAEAAHLNSRQRAQQKFTPAGLLDKLPKTAQAIERREAARGDNRPPLDSRPAVAGTPPTDEEMFDAIERANRPRDASPLD